VKATAHAIRRRSAVDFRRRLVLCSSRRLLEGEALCVPVLSVRGAAERCETIYPEYIAKMKKMKVLPRPADKAGSQPGEAQ